MTADMHLSPGQFTLPGTEHLGTKPGGPSARDWADARYENFLHANPDMRPPTVAQQHSRGAYQAPLPGTGHLGTDNAPVGSLFHHPEVTGEDGESGSDHYMSQRVNNRSVERHRVADLHPTQPVVEDSYLYKSPSAFDGYPHVVRHPESGELHIMDGHHRTARAILAGKQFINVVRHHE